MKKLIIDTLLLPLFARYGLALRVKCRHCGEQDWFYTDLETPLKQTVDDGKYLHDDCRDAFYAAKKNPEAV